MSKLARVLAVGALLTAMSLGSTAYAQDGDAQSQQAGVTQSDPSQPQPPGTPEDPGTPGSPGTTPGSTTTTTTHQPVVRPTSLPVTVSPRAGGPGTTVTLRADLRGCTRPGSARGFFNEVHEWDTDGLSKWLVSEHVNGGRWYTGRYRITDKIPAGLGPLRRDLRQRPAKLHRRLRHLPGAALDSTVPVRVTPQRAARGTTVKITAEVGWCEQDPDTGSMTARPMGLPRPAGPMNHALQGHRCRHRSPPATPSPARTHRPSGSSDLLCEHHKPAIRLGQLPGPRRQQRWRLWRPRPDRQPQWLPGPQPDRHRPRRYRRRRQQGGLDPAWLLPAAGLLLIALAVGLRRRQTTVRRRR